jgi:hypothetical protein
MTPAANTPWAQNVRLRMLAPAVRLRACAGCRDDAIAAVCLTEGGSAQGRSGTWPPSNPLNQGDGLCTEQSGDTG